MLASVSTKTRHPAPGVIVAFRGEIGAGKTTAARCLRDAYGFVVESFAAPLKDLVRQITPAGRIDKLRDRNLLAYIGTDYYRNVVDPDYWVTALAQRVEPLLAAGRNVVVDDCRGFPNELDYIASRPGSIIAWLDVPAAKIDQRLQARDGAIERGLPGHESETFNDPRDPHITLRIPNGGTIEDLQRYLHVSIGARLALRAPALCSPPSLVPRGARLRVVY